MRDLRKIKLVALLVSITCCFFMFSVGFSAWFNISAPAPVTPDDTGSLESYDVLTIHMKGDNGMKVFKSSLLSFKDSDTLEDSKTGTGTIEATYVVPKSTVEATAGSFTVDFSLGYSSLSLNGHQLFGHAFSTTYKDNSYSASVVYGANNETKIDLTPQFLSVQDDQVIDDTIICSYTFENIPTTDDFEFTLIYTFKIPKGINFKESFGQYLNGTESTEDNPSDTTKFSASAVVKDYTE